MRPVQKLIILVKKDIFVLFFFALFLLYLRRGPSQWSSQNGGAGLRHSFSRNDARKYFVNIALLYINVLRGSCERGMICDHDNYMESLNRMELVARNKLIWFFERSRCRALLEWISRMKRCINLSTKPGFEKYSGKREKGAFPDKARSSEDVRESGGRRVIYPSCSLLYLTHPSGVHISDFLVL